MVSQGLLPRTPKIRNTGEAQPGSPILQAVHEMQAATVTAGDNFQISNNRKNQDAEIGHPVSNRPLTFHNLSSTHKPLVIVSWECYDIYLHSVSNRPVILIIISCLTAR